MRDMVRRVVRFPLIRGAVFATSEVLLRLGIYYTIKQRLWDNKETKFIDALQKQFYSHYITKEDIVFDVGANVGQRTSIFSDLSRCVVAIEPHPKYARHLKYRFKASKNVFIEPVALSNKEGQAVLYEKKPSRLCHLSLSKQ